MRAKEILIKAQVIEHQIKGTKGHCGKTGDWFEPIPLIQKFTLYYFVKYFFNYIAKMV